MQQNTLPDYMHAGIATSIAGAISFWVFGKQPWAFQATLFSLLMFAYLWYFWKAVDVVAQEAQETITQAAPAWTDNFVMPGPVATPARANGGRVEKPAKAGETPVILSIYQREAIKINGLLKSAYCLNARIEWEKSDKIILAPDFVGYVIKQIGTLEFGKLQAIEDDIAREIKETSRGNQGEDIGVIFVNSQPIVMQVTRKNPKLLTWEERPKDTKPLQATVAKYWKGVSERYLTIDLTSDDLVNGAAFGQPGAGKSTFLHIALIALLHSTPPDMLEVYAIDMKKDMFSEYKGIPHIKETAFTIEDAVRIIEMFTNWCVAGNFPTDGKIRLLIIDEFQMAVTHTRYGDVAMQKIMEVLERGREAGIRVWTATQNPDARSYPTNLKPRTHFMACGYIMNDDYVRRQLKIYGASKLRSKGEMMFVGPYGDYRVKTFWLTADIRHKEIALLRQKWGGAPENYVAARPDPMPSPLDQGGDRSRSEVDQSVTLNTDTPWKLPNRALSPGEEKAVCRLWTDERFATNGKPSINKVIVHVYEGAKNTDKIKWIKYALQKGGYTYE